MGIEANEIIQEIKKAEEEAQRMIEEVERDMKIALSAAEAKAAEDVERFRDILQENMARALAETEKEAREMYDNIVRTAKEQAEKLKGVPPGRMKQAVDLLVENVKNKWQ